MEPGSQAGVLQEILDRLCRESDPAKIYKDLKELSSVPILRDSLAEIGFRKTIKSLKRQQLLVQFVKDLVAKWSPGFLPGPQPEQVPLDFGSVRSPRTAEQSTALEETSQEQVFQAPQLRSLDPGDYRSSKYQLAEQNPEQVPAPCKRKREPPWPAEAQRPRAKIPRGDSPRSKDQRPIADSASPETQCTGQACLEVDVVPEPSSSQQNEEASPWDWELRKYQKTPVHSGRPSAHACHGQSHPGLLGKDPAGIRHATNCPSAKERAEPGLSEEKTQSKIPTSHQTQSRPGPSTPLCLQQSQEERLQALRARLESSRDKRLQARQTKMISFHTQHKSPGRQGEPGPRGLPSAPTSYSLPEAPAHRGAHKPSCLPSGAKGSKKVPAKRPAPLMAKALRDYSRRFYTN